MTTYTNQRQTTYINVYIEPLTHLINISFKELGRFPGELK